MKTLLLNTKANFSFSEDVDFFVITLNANQIEKIKKLAAVLTEQGAYSIEYFDNDGKYFSILEVQEILDELNIDSEDLTMEKINQCKNPTPSTIMELNMVKVYTDGFRFSAVKKHTDDKYISTKVFLKELDNEETLDVLEF